MILCCKTNYYWNCYAALDNMLLLLHGAECNVGNIFQLSTILQLISSAFRQVK